eukprot:2903721-Pleurochrysis_carterae.AAC.5
MLETGAEMKALKGGTRVRRGKGACVRAREAKKSIVWARKERSSGHEKSVRLGTKSVRLGTERASVWAWKLQSGHGKSFSLGTERASVWARKELQSGHGKSISQGTEER